MRPTIARGAFCALLIIGAACGSPDATSPPATNSAPGTPVPAPPAPPAPPTKNFPVPAGASRTFVFDHELSYHVSGYTKDSRFILYDDHAFVLRFEGLNVDYRGGYTEENGAIVFDWEGWSAAGPWGATGTLNGDTLTVNYNIIMSLTDFEDAVYVLDR